MNKKISITILMLILAVSLVMSQSNNSEIPTSINEDGTPPEASAILDIQSNSKGMLVPRMTTAQRSTIANPATGLLVYDSNTNSFWFYDSSAWTDLSSSAGADADWTVTPIGIRTDSLVAINTSTIDPNSNLYVYRPLEDFGADKAAIYGFRSGSANESANGGSSFSYTGIDTAVKGFSNWGNSYSAGVAGHSYLDYENSAAVLGGQRAGNVFGALGFRDSTQVWAGYFDGDVRFRPESTYTPELYLDIERRYINQGQEFGQWHQLYVIPNSRNTNAPDYDYYYLGDNTHHFDGAYVNAINPENSLLINGNTVVTDNNDLAVGTTLPGMKLHVKQDIANRGIRTEHQSTADYWDTGIGLTTKNYKFYYNNISKADIVSSDGAYMQPSDESLKSDITYLPSVLDKVLDLKPATYFYKDTKDKANQKSMGFIAQDVEAIIPEIVRTREDGLKALAYDDFGILAIKAIQEQQVMIQEMKKEIEELKSKE